jgi:hypothetical protein
LTERLIATAGTYHAGLGEGRAAATSSVQLPSHCLATARIAEEREESIAALDHEALKASSQRIAWTQARQASPQLPSFGHGESAEQALEIALASFVASPVPLGWIHGRSMAAIITSSPGIAIGASGAVGAAPGTGSQIGGASRRATWWARSRRLIGRGVGDPIESLRSCRFVLVMEPLSSSPPRGCVTCEFSAVPLFCNRPQL